MLDNIIIIIICVILSICFVLFINRDKLSFNCCKRNKYTNYAVMDIDIINNNIHKLQDKREEKIEIENELL